MRKRTQIALNPAVLSLQITIRIKNAVFKIFDNPSSGGDFVRVNIRAQKSETLIRKLKFYFSGMQRQRKNNHQSIFADYFQYIWQFGNIHHGRG